MSEVLKPDVLVVGGGPGGYVAAIRAGQLGLKTVLVEGDRLGGTCLIRGCIPSKALIHAAGVWSEICAVTEPGGQIGIHCVAPPRLDFGETSKWKDGIVDRLSGGVAGLLKKARVHVIHGWARFTDARSCVIETGGDTVQIRSSHVILATGSVSATLTNLPIGGKVISSTGALSLAEVPKKLVVVGGGYIGLELGSAFAKLGAEVSIVEAQNRILRLYDAELSEPVRRWLDQQGVAIHLGSRVLGVANEGLEIESQAGGRMVLPADRILVTIGRRPLTEGWGLERMALEMDGAFVRVDDRCATSTTNVWAIGDLVGEPMLAHKASSQGEMVAEIIAGKRRRFDPTTLATVCFTEPEIVSVGMLPGDGSDVDYLVGLFPFQANGRALTMQADGMGGFVRIVARKSDHRVLGIQAVGKHVSELSSQFATILEMGAVLEDVAGTIHVHPTLGEAVHESALKALGHAIHL